MNILRTRPKGYLEFYAGSSVLSDLVPKTQNSRNKHTEGKIPSMRFHMKTRVEE